MTVDDLAQVRSFNRTVTRRIGALDDAFLARDRPLGPSRVLWEIGTVGTGSVGTGSVGTGTVGTGTVGTGTDVRALRSRLGLDSGYLSRVLRSLQDDGLVTVEPGVPDRRVRTARLTEAGRSERAELDRRSDRWAEALLGRLSTGQRSRLVTAMADVERLLTAATVDISPADPHEPASRACLDAYFRELDERFEGGFDPALSSAGLDDLAPPAGVLLVATLDAEPVGCGGLVLHGDGPAVIKRMWVSPSVRGTGLGRRLLEALEDHAREVGVDVVQLDTHRSLTEAIAMYTSAGYAQTDQVTEEVYAELWFEKRLRPR